MEREKRKKMSPENGGVVEETTTTTKKKSKKQKRETTPPPPPPTAAAEEEPTTEEVEEFYAILRRMDVAMRYLKGRVQKRPAPAEETAVVVRIGEVEENKELNLNEMPSDSNN